jgi:hypothetical protein
LTENELTELFRGAGFRVEDLQILSNAAKDDKLSGPAIPANVNAESPFGGWKAS